MENIIRVDHVNVGYDKKTVVEEVHFKGLRGQMICLLGPNGAGKSTILRTISGLLEPVDGAVYIDGENIAMMKKDILAKKLAVVLTEQVTPQMTTVYEIAAMGRNPYTNFWGKLSRDDRLIIDHALETVGAYKLKDRYYAELSDGEKQKVMIARALVQQPELIVLDEPTSHLDIRHKIEIIHILNKLCRTMGITVILSLHDIDLAIKGCQTLILVKDGKILTQGAPEDVIRNETVQTLYDIEGAHYNEKMGSVELDGINTEDAFVISGNGTGIGIYRSLSRWGYGIASGILYENDIDTQVAKTICSRVIEEKAFEPIGDIQVRKARKAVSEAGFVVDTGFPAGQYYRENIELINYALKKHKTVYSLRAAKESRQFFGDLSGNIIYCGSATELVKTLHYYKKTAVIKTAGENYFGRGV